MGKKSLDKGGEKAADTWPNDPSSDSKPEALREPDVEGGSHETDV